MNDPLFSVIIPVYNRAVVLRRAIDSVLSQTFVQFELIIVNDGSTDSTKKIIMSYSDPRIRFFESPNCGVSHARNIGICNAKAPYIALLDSDDSWLPEKLALDAAFAEQHSELLIYQSDEYWIRNGKQVNKRKIHQKRSGYIFPESLRLCMISPSSVVIHRSLFDEVGLFDERMCVCEDYDLWLRITRKYPVGLIPAKTITKYGGHPDQLSRSVSAIDRYRVFAILKLLHEQRLTEAQRTCAVEELRRKSAILSEGAQKRGNDALVAYLRYMMRAVTEGSRLPDGLFLLEE